MSYTKRPDLIPDTRAIALLPDGDQARVVRVVEATIDGPRIEIEGGEIVQARQIIKPETSGLVVELDSGHLVLVEYVTKAIKETLSVSIHVIAAWVDENLDPMLGANGLPVTVEFKHSCGQAQQDDIGVAGALRECLRLVLGEPLELIAPPPADPNNAEPQPEAMTLIQWPMETVLANDIRRAINIAEQATAIDLGALL